MNRPTSPPASHRTARIVFCALFGLVPLVMDSDLYTLTLMPRRLLVQLGMLAILTVILADLRGKRITPQLDRAVSPPVVIYLLFAAASVALATHRLAAVDAVVHQLTFAAVFFAAAWAFPVGALISAFRITAGVGILVSIIGIAEFIGADVSFLTSNGRPSATFGYRNFAAAWLIVALPQAIALFLKPDRDRDRLLGGGAVGLMLVFLIYTRTRGAWAGLLGAAVFSAVLVLLTRHPDRRYGIRPFKGNAMWMSAGGLAILVLLAVQPARIAAPQARQLDTAKASLTSSVASVLASGGDRGRRALWQGTVEMIRDRPAGVGAGNWYAHYPLYDDGTMLKPGSSPERPHNDYLWIAAELGVQGLLAYAWLLAALAFAGWRAVRKTSDAHRLPLLALGTGMVATLGHALVSFPRELVEPSFLFWFGAGILAAEARNRERRKASTSPLARGIAYALPVFLAAGVWVSLQHIRFDADYLEALEFHAGGDVRSLLDRTTKAVEAGAFRSDVYVLKSKGHQAFGDLRSAREACLEGLALNPNSVELTAELGLVYAMLDSLGPAETALRRVLDLAPGYFQVYNNLGGVYQKAGRLDRAIATYREAIAASPAYVDAWSNLGLALLQDGRIDEAIEAARRAVELDPRDPVLQHNLGDALFARAATDATFYPLAARAYDAFLRTWRGPAAQAERARQRLLQARERSDR